MNIEPFGVEIWMNEFETKCELNLAETCVHSITVSELLELCSKPTGSLDEILELRLGYGAIPGSERLRKAIAKLYTKQSSEQIVVTHGTIGANSLVHQTLVSPGDHVIPIVPTYQQHYSIPQSIGATVTPLQLSSDDGWLPDLSRLQELVHADTRLIAMTNPNNPTGSLMSESMLVRIADIARSVDAWVLCDEVYRGTDQKGAGATPSMADLYEKGISTAGMSKAFSLAGLRLGWIAAPADVIEAVMIHRDYNTISVGVIDDHLACMALEHHQRLLARSQAITRENLAVLKAWIASEEKIDFVAPESGTTALLEYHLDMPSRALCLELLEHTGVMLTPGSVMGIEGHLRLGFANSLLTLREGLDRMSHFFSNK
ncbi:MAG: aminotransferase [Congregibacter sp.]